MDKIWLKNYLPSVPAVIDENQYSSLVDLFKKSCEQFSDKPAFTQLGVSLTYKAIDQQTRYFAAYLETEFKLKKDDRFVIMLPNSLQFVIALFGALRLGLVVVAINPLDTPRELEYQLNDSKAKAILVLDQFLHVVNAVYKKTHLKHVISTEFGDVFPFFKRYLVNWALKMKHSKKELIELPLLFAREIKQFRFVLKEGKNLIFKEPQINSNDLAFLQYTGGTTGIPKGAMLTHQNMVANVIQCITWVKPVVSVGKEKILIALPLYHIFSLTVCCLSFLAIGGLGILIADPRNINYVVNVLKNEKPTVFVGVNTLFNALINHRVFQSLNFPLFHLTVSGGMKMEKDVATRWHKITGSVVLEGYGLTEASPVVTVNPVNLQEFNGSIGLPLPSTEVSIRNELNEAVGLKEIGELWVRGPQVMKGYWQREEDTQAVLTEEGWLKTGDMAYIDEEGFIYLVDRKKELIIVSGFNVYPNEVESVLAAYPGILEAAVVGLPDAVVGERVKAYVVKKNPEVSVEALLKHCKANLLPYKIPKQIEFVTSLPKSPVGKVLKRLLK